MGGLAMPIRQPHSAYRAVALVLAVLASLACGKATTLVQATSSAEYYQAGLEAYAAGDYEQAGANFDYAIEADPNFEKAYYASAEILYLRGEYELAIDEYGRALELKYEPAARAYAGQADAYEGIGEFKLSSRDYGEARALNREFIGDYYPDRRQAFSKVIDAHPELAGAYYARGRANYLLKDYQAAIEDFSAAIKREHKPLTRAYYARGQAHYALEEFQPAVEDYSSAIELDPGSVYAYLGRGRAHIQLAEFVAGLADIDRALEIDPNFTDGHNNRCWFGSILGKAAQVMDSCEAAVTLQPNTPAYMDSRGLARALTGDYAGAIEDFQFYVDYTGDKERVFWIAELKAGRNPFDAATLEALLDQ